MYKRSFQNNLFISVGVLFILYVIFFSIYQYNREKNYKIDVMHSRLQMYNYELAQTLGDSILNKTAFYDYVSTHEIEGMRVTLISEDGHVLLDSEHKDVNNIPNHSHRTEVLQALQRGNGYDIKRVSELTNQTYFYSATHIGKYIVRSAIPYNAALTKSLQADYSYIWFAVIVTFLLGVVLYRNTSRIGKHIGYLREFAMKAEKGEELDHELERRLPDDELGDISHNIITLYWKLRHSEEDKQRIKKQLTQNAAHELKTPAASIHGYLESILDNPDMPEEQRQHFLERCYAQSERMNKLLLDMAQLTKLDGETHPPSIVSLPLSVSPFSGSRNLPLVGRGDSNSTEFSTRIDIVPIIRNAFDDTALQLKEKGINVELAIPEKILVLSPFTESEGVSVIYSIFRNLIDNAIAYATGATAIKIICKRNQNLSPADKIGEDFEFTFSDNGVGVEIQHLSHLFERFYRVDKGRSRKLGGTGLGLAIVKNSVAAFGGTTTAEPTPGGGLTIRFTLKKAQ